MSSLTFIRGLLLSALCGAACTVALAGDLAAGRSKAAAACQVCHGMDGQATQPMVAHISGQQKEYLVAQLEAYRSGERQHVQMSIISSTLTDADIDNLAEWYSNIEVAVTPPD